MPICKPGTPPKKKQKTNGETTLNPTPLRLHHQGEFTDWQRAASQLCRRLACPHETFRGSGAGALPACLCASWKLTVRHSDGWTREGIQRKADGSLPLDALCGCSQESFQGERQGWQSFSKPPRNFPEALKGCDSSTRTLSADLLGLQPPLRVHEG